MPRPSGDPAPMSYLSDSQDQASGGLDITLEASLTPGSGAPQRLSQGTARDLYWTVAQMVAHHTIGGCNMRVGDLLGSGTISGTETGTEGAMIEITKAGKNPIKLEGGDERRFLQDGDTVTLTGVCGNEDYGLVGFGECVGTITPALTLYQ